MISGKNLQIAKLGAKENAWYELEFIPDAENDTKIALDGIYRKWKELDLELSSVELKKQIATDIPYYRNAIRERVLSLLLLNGARVKE